MIYADSYFVYLYNITSKTPKSFEDHHDHHDSDIGISQKKFIGICLWIIGYFITLIFTKNIYLLATLFIFALSIGENYVLRSGKQKRIDIHSDEKAFNFSDNKTKLSYAKAKFILTIGLSVVYIILSSLIFSGYSGSS